MEDAAAPSGSAAGGAAEPAVPASGGAFAPGPGARLISEMLDWGAAGVGQSSWGPAVYGIVGDAAAGAALADRARAALGDEGTVYESTFSHTGAKVWTDG